MGILDQGDYIVNYTAREINISHHLLMTRVIALSMDIGAVILSMAIQKNILDNPDLFIYFLYFLVADYFGSSSNCYVWPAIPKKHSDFILTAPPD